jgi:glycosyltransferase involved in cell wall biosynthesis
MPLDSVPNGKMKIAILNLTGGGLSHGYINYLSELLPRMVGHARVSQVHCCVPSGFSPVFAGILPSAYLWEYEDTLAGRRRLRQEVVPLAPDVVFFPGNRWMNLGGIPSVAMIQSMLPMVMPFGGNGLRDIIKNLIRARLSRTACERAQRVIAVSRYVQQFLVDTWHISADRIGMVYHGVKPQPEAAALKIPAGVPGEWCGSFLFTAGSMHPYRGLDDVIQALAVLASQGVRLSMVVAGGTETDPTQLPYFQKMQSLAEKMGIQSQVAWVGHLEAAEMSWCYLNCRLFLMTSRVEACPNIALEALSHGAFCLAADNPPLPEFFQDAAIYYRPRSAEALAQAITAALAYSQEEAGLMQRQAQARAADFTWEKTTELTVHELELAKDMV